MQKSKAFNRLPNTHTKKSRFGLTKGAGQCFIFLERYVWEDNWSGETVSFLARHLS